MYKYMYVNALKYNTFLFFKNLYNNFVILSAKLAYIDYICIMLKEFTPLRAPNVFIYASIFFLLNLNQINLRRRPEILKLLWKIQKLKKQKCNDHLACSLSSNALILLFYISNTNYVLCHRCCCKYYLHIIQQLCITQTENACS